MSEGKRKPHPNSLANLRPKPWQKGQSGNPAGRKSLGAYVSEYLNSMATWSPKQVESVIADPATPMSQLLAATRILSAIQEGADFDRVLDRTVGKPTTNGQLDVRQEIVPPLERSVVLPLPDQPQE